MVINIRSIFKDLQICFFIVCILFLIRYIIDSWSSIQSILQYADYTKMAVSLVLWTIIVFIIPLFSCLLTNNMDSPVNYSVMLSIYLKRLPAKYIPGGIWQTVSRAYDLSVAGMKKQEIAVLVLYENLWSAVVSGLLGGVGLLILNDQNIYWSTFSKLILFGIFFIMLCVFFFKKHDFVLPLKTYFYISIVNILFWSIASFSFWYYLQSFGFYNDTLTFYRSSVYYCVSWLVGFISIFSPQGIGIFEISFYKLALSNNPLSEIIIVLAGFRFITLCSDIVVWVIYSILIKK